jgi:uncharacterized protein with HEPN domain
MSRKRHRPHRWRGPRRHDRHFRLWPERVRDILNAAKELMAFTAGMTFEEFAADRRTLKAALADIAIMGEAARFIPGRLAAAHPQIPFDDLRETRNFVIHTYFHVEPRVLWETIKIELPSLVRRLEELLAKHHPEKPPGRNPDED